MMQGSLEWLQSIQTLKEISAELKQILTKDVYKLKLKAQYIMTGWATPIEITPTEQMLIWFQKDIHVIRLFYMLSVHMTWLLNGSETVGNLALIQTSMFFHGLKFAS